MTILVSGLNGTLAPRLARCLASQGHHVIGWDRAEHPPEDPTAWRDWLRQLKPSAVYHLANGSPDWAGELALECARAGRPFVYTSSVSVFSIHQQGPFTVDRVPAPEDEYGRYKLECEMRVRENHPGACIVRLGWQIGEDLTGNQMQAQLEAQQQREGRILASARWQPACSFLDDSAACLAGLAGRSGLYHLDGNPGLSCHAIVRALALRFARDWRVEASEEFVWTSRLLDERLQPVSIEERLTAPPATQGSH
ncbi:MAG: sugar nucleotide-binding protein [Candidatus Delongbacteria bacterium]|nr:sugar nucleotide-binding protein [Candidatus Delongbacteria bacterium]